MHLGRIGGLLILGSGGLFAVTVFLALAGSSVSVGGSEPGALTATVALGLLAIGAGLLGTAGSSALHGRAARLGLIVAAVGLAAELATARVSASSMLVVVFLLGGAVFALGCVVTVLALLRARGPERAAALTILAGISIAAISAVVVNFAPAVPGQDASPLRILCLAIAGAGGVTILGGVIRIALLGIDLHARTGKADA